MFDSIQTGWLSEECLVTATLQSRVAIRIQCYLAMGQYLALPRCCLFTFKMRQNDQGHSVTDIH